MFNKHHLLSVQQRPVFHISGGSDGEEVSKTLSTASILALTPSLTRILTRYRTGASSFFHGATEHHLLRYTHQAGGLMPQYSLNHLYSTTY